MFDPSTFKFKKVPKEVWDSSEENAKCNDPMAIDKTVMDRSDRINSKLEANRLFHSNDIKSKIMAHNNLSLFGDKDNDKSLNIFDENPKKKDEVDRIKRIIG